MLLYSFLHEARQKAKSERSVTDGRGTFHVGSSETENPFRSHLLNKETVEMYRDLLNRPLPRLPKLYTLPSRLPAFVHLQCVVCVCYTRVLLVW